MSVANTKWGKVARRMLIGTIAAYIMLLVYCVVQSMVAQLFAALLGLAFSVFSLWLIHFKRIEVKHGGT